MSTTDFSHVAFISAGAGSGKTYRLTQELERTLVQGNINPAHVIGTTFTVKAAEELTERVRSRLIQSGHLQLAEEMGQALLGTVHSVCERLLQRFAFELGLSPVLRVASEQDGIRLFNQALDEVLTANRMRELNGLAERLGIKSWQNHVQHIAAQVRQNDLDGADLPDMAHQSIQTLLRFFPEPQQNAAAGLDANLQRALDEGLAAIDLTHDTTIKTHEYHKLMKRAAHALRQGRITWPNWVQLACGTTGAKSREAAAPIQSAAAAYDSHPNLHTDLQAYIRGVMETASQALARFHSLKTERGLIDFLDMEQLTLHALDLTEVRERLSEELDLLLVDEFQDTNPMQLALFVKLARLAKQAIFVGDVKQAIYAFRGCDADLVFATLAGMTRAQASTDQLSSNWRSRPHLVHYVNAVFAAAFEQDGMSADDITLTPERSEQVSSPALLTWQVPGNTSKQFPVLAEGIAELVTGGHTIVDPDTMQPRAVSWGDIAVLARTNDHVANIARTLKNQGIPVKISLAGLLATPEAVLARACLRRINDSYDTLATAEIMALADRADPEIWLSARLSYLNDSEPQDNHRWGESDHPIIKRLTELAAITALQSPVEIVARAINEVELRRIVTGWGPDAIKAAQRQRNLDAFQGLAQHYEDHCATHHEAATLTGFLFWLENPTSAELDLQPVITSGDAVHVLTYHKAKGLEWPVVIATDLRTKPRNALFGVSVQMDAPFDIHNPLANRTIQFWPNLFGERKNAVPVLDRMLTSNEGQMRIKQAEAEDRRLAYVGFTRARDTLALAVAPAPKNGAPTWLDSFDSGFTVPIADPHPLPQDVSIPVRIGAASEEVVDIEPAPFMPSWYINREREDGLASAYLSPSSAPPIDTARISHTTNLGERIQLRSDDMAAIGNALHAVIAAELVNPDQSDAEACAEKILAAHQVQGHVQAADAVRAARRLRKVLFEELGATQCIAECPVQHVLEDGRVVRGFIDLLVETPQGNMIIDHKSSPQPRKNWANEVIENAGQLQRYENAVTAATGSVPRIALHFPISAGLVQVELEREQPANE